MASYEFIASESTINVVSADRVENAQRVTARAVPSGVVYSVLFSPYPGDVFGEPLWTPETINELLETWGTWYNEDALVPGVVNIAVTQGINPAGELADVLLLTVGSTSGRSTTTVPLYNGNDWNGQLFRNQVEYWRGQLDATEAAGA